MGTLWRPALRCDSIYRDYIDSLYKVTSLDKNQIMRLMLFVAAHTEDFRRIVSEYKKGDVTILPEPVWEAWEDPYWLNQTYQVKRSDVTVKTIDIETIKLTGKCGVISYALPPLT